MSSNIILERGPSWSWLYGSWVYKYLCTPCLSPPSLWVWTLFVVRCTRYNIMWSSLSMICNRTQWFSPGTLVSSTNKTDHHDITEILLKVALNTINQPNQPYLKTSSAKPILFWFFAHLSKSHACEF